MYDLYIVGEFVEGCDCDDWLDMFDEIDKFVLGLRCVVIVG